MADLNALKQKYAPVIEEIQSFSDLGATLDEPTLDGEQLHLKASVPSTVVANRVWDAIKATDATYSDLHHEMSTAGGETQAYTIKSATIYLKLPSAFMERRASIRRLPKPTGLPTRTRSAWARSLR